MALSVLVVRGWQVDRGRRSEIGRRYYQDAVIAGELAGEIECTGALAEIGQSDQYKTGGRIELIDLGGVVSVGQPIDLDADADILCVGQGSDQQ